MVHTAVKSRYLVRQPGPARVSFAHGDGWVAVPYYDIRECRLDHSRPDATLFLKHNEYTIILRGHNLRQLYWSLLLEEVAEIPTSEPNTVQPADSYVTNLEVLPNEDSVPPADFLPD
jgi:hypothetical protein